MRRVKIAAKEAAQSIDAPMAFKQAGLPNALDGSEDHLILSHLKPVWAKLKVAEWRAEYLDKHQPGQMDPLILWHSLESLLPLDDDTEESDDPTDGEGVDEDESDDGVDGDNGNHGDSDDEDGDTGGEAQPLPDVVMFKQAMQLTNETGSPRLQACLKRYIPLKENEHKTKARRLLAEPNRIPLDAGLEPVDGDPFVQQEDAPAPPPPPANPIDVPGGEVRDESGSGGEEEEEYKADRIIAKKIRPGKPTYLVRWKGCGEEEDSWEPLAHLTGCQELVDTLEASERDRSMVRSVGLGLRH